MIALIRHHKGSSLNTVSLHDCNVYEEGLFVWDYNHGRILACRETGDSPPNKFEVGDGPYIRPHNILRIIVVGCEEKYEVTKRKFQRRIKSSETEVSRQERLI